MQSYSSYTSSDHVPYNMKNYSQIDHPHFKPNETSVCLTENANAQILNNPYSNPEK